MMRTLWTMLRFALSLLLLRWAVSLSPRDSAGLLARVARAAERRVQGQDTGDAAATAEAEVHRWLQGQSRTEGAEGEQPEEGADVDVLLAEIEALADRVDANGLSLVWCTELNQHGGFHEDRRGEWFRQVLLLAAALAHDGAQQPELQQHILRVLHDHWSGEEQVVVEQPAHRIN